MKTFAQITDLHITTPDNPYGAEVGVRDEKRLREALTAIYALQPRPVAIIASGDLVDRGLPREYEELKRILSDYREIPIYAGMGNHDLRGPFREAFQNSTLLRYESDKNGFIQYEADFDDIRLVMIDTLDEINGGTDHNENGAFCNKRAAWLKRTLGRNSKKATILALHHPPIRSGIYWMDERESYDWQPRLASCVKDRKQVRTMVCGHLHRAYHSTFANRTVAASPATSIQLTLNLTPVDLRVPDGRSILVDEPVGFSLHMWDRGELTTHVCVAGGFPSAVQYQFAFQKT